MVLAKQAIRAIRGYAPNQKAADRLMAYGLKPLAIYRGDKGQTVDKFKMRKGEYLGVVDGLLAFGSERRAMLAAIKAVHATGASILDVETNKCSRRDGAEMLDDAEKGPAMTAEQARAMQEASVDARVKGRMPFHMARSIWLGYPLLKTNQILSMMPKWKRATAHKAFGPRKVPAGRRPK
jgi:hypothetical protein